MYESKRSRCPDFSFGGLVVETDISNGRIVWMGKESRGGAPGLVGGISVVSGVCSGVVSTTLVRITSC